MRSSFTEVDHTLVLLSIEDAVWKIADFGLSAEGMSQRAYSTQRARGTQCYRAPELLSETSIVSRKSDIWAFGCILFELVFPLKAFKNDFQVFQFAASRSRPTFPSLPEGIDQRSRVYLEQSLFSALDIAWWKRPSAQAFVAMMESLSEETTDVFKLETPTGPLNGRPTPLYNDVKGWKEVTWRHYWYLLAFVN